MPHLTKLFQSHLLKNLQIKMTQHIEGNWKEATFRMLTESDATSVYDFLKINYWPDEILSSSVGWSDAKGRDCAKNVAVIIDQNLSFGAYHTETNEILGICLNSFDKKDEQDHWGFEAESDSRTILNKFCVSIETEVNVFDKYNVDKYAEIRIASVSKNFRQKGLAYEMFRRSLPCLRDLGFKLVKSLVTSPYSQAITTRLGFHEIARRNYREMVDLKGNQLRPEATDKDFMSLVVLQL